MIKANEYFDGNVKSIGHEVKGQSFTVGIMEPGDYSFGTTTEEIMEVVFGEMDVVLPDGTAKIYSKGESFTVPANKEFKVTAKDPVSYICLYK